MLLLDLDLAGGWGGVFKPPHLVRDPRQPAHLLLAVAGGRHHRPPAFRATTESLGHHRPLTRMQPLRSIPAGRYIVSVLGGVARNFRIASSLASAATWAFRRAVCFFPFYGGLVHLLISWHPFITSNARNLKGIIAAVADYFDAFSGWPVARAHTTVAWVLPRDRPDATRAPRAPRAGRPVGM